MNTFVVPSLSGPITGGTRYNRCLVAALNELGEPPEVLSLEEACVVAREPTPRRVWLDSLWLGRLGRLAELAHPRCRVGLLAHYLPSLVTHGERPHPQALSSDEREAIARATAFVVPSEYLASELSALGAQRTRIMVIEPGVEQPVQARPPADDRVGPVRALVVANVVEGKGILPLLDGLAAVVRPGEEVQLDVVGSTTMDRAYAERCLERVARAATLRERVRFHGALEYRDCIAALLRADVLVSASRMESYGMALADARACGRPILARVGGNVASHVDPRWGARLFADEASLADACVALSRDRDELRDRQRRAWAHRRSRPWTTSAAALLSDARRRPTPRPPQ